MINDVLKVILKVNLGNNHVCYLIKGFKNERRI